MSSQRNKLFTRSCDRGQKESHLYSYDETFISSRASPNSCSNDTNRAGERGGGLFVERYQEPNDLLQYMPEEKTDILLTQFFNMESYLKQRRSS